MTTHWPIYRMVEEEADKAFEVHMEDTWNNLNQVAWETLRDLLQKIQELEQVWIPVEEWLPPSYQKVIGYSDWLVTMVWYAPWMNDWFYWDGDELKKVADVTHWMPLPPTTK